MGKTNTEYQSFSYNQISWKYDTDTTILSWGDMNVMQHGVENPHLIHLDALSQD